MGTPAHKRNYTNETKWQKRPAQKRKKRARDNARYAAIKAGKVKRGDGKHIDHKKPLARGGSKAKSNTRVVSARKNLSSGAKLSKGNPTGKGGKRKKR